MFRSRPERPETFILGGSPQSHETFLQTAEEQHERHVADTLGIAVTDVRENFLSTDAAKLICARYPNKRPEELVGLAYDSLFKQFNSEQILKGRGG